MLPTINPWIEQIFGADAVKNKGIVRRNKHDVEDKATLYDLLTEVRRRGFHLIETGDQYVVICNSGALVIHC